MRTSFPLAFLLTAMLAVTTAQAATRTWTGAGSDNKFSTVANWAEMIAPVPGDDLIFPASAAQYSLFDDMFLDQILNSVTFEGGNYSIGGYGKTRGVTVNAGNQTLGPSIWTLFGRVFIESGANLSATLFGRDSNFTIDGPGTSSFFFGTSYGGVITKQGTGTTSITAPPSGLYSITVNGGRLTCVCRGNNGPITVNEGVVESNYINTNRLKVTGSDSEFIGTGGAGIFEISNGAKFSPTSCFVSIQSSNPILSGGI